MQKYPTRQAARGFSTRFPRMLQHLRRPELLVFLPAITLAAFWIGGESMMILTALGLPMLFAVAGAFGRGDFETKQVQAFDGLALRPQIVRSMHTILADSAISGHTTGCLVIRLDDPDHLRATYGRSEMGAVLTRTAERISAALRPGDVLARTDDNSFALGLSPVRHLDLEIMLQLSARLQSALSPAVSINATKVYATFSVGFCLGAQAPLPTGDALLDAAEAAAADAAQHGPGAIRAFTPDMARRKSQDLTQRELLATALEDGSIRPHFQPQINTDTGDISGFEALARWYHPERGLVPPMDFLPAIDAAGLSERLSEVMLGNALAALSAWEREGFYVPTVGVNFSATELRNPRLAEKLKWELDRHELTPDRLAVEVLETVVALSDNDVIARNMVQLSKLGCGIDLDDFGIGQASIASIRRFAVRRIKVDRSFITKIDEDRSQQQIVSAILSLAERMEVQTLAEGVETPGEHAILAQLGCNHVQGFLIARPMPFEETLDWMRTYRARRPAAVAIGNRNR